MILHQFDKYRPIPTYHPYPPYHKGLYLEDYFYYYYYNNNIQTQRILIPVSWTTLYIENKREGLQEVLDELNPNRSYFAISQFDNAIMEKLPPDTMKFCAGGNMGGIPIPLVCSPIPKEDIITNKRDLLCSFHGSITHYFRQYLAVTLADKKNVVIKNSVWSNKVSDENYRTYLDLASRSKFLLCPRGYGPHSFRVYESFQLGCVPVIITDIRFLPWEDELDWNTFAVVIDNNIGELYNILNNIPQEQYQKLLYTGQKLYKDYFTLEGTCKNIIKRLKNNEN